jgi:hypothetical protein
MGFLLAHWHCVAPIAVIGIVMLFMRRGDKSDKHEGDNL